MLRRIDKRDTFSLMVSDNDVDDIIDAFEQAIDDVKGSVTEVSSSNYRVTLKFNISVFEDVNGTTQVIVPVGAGEEGGNENQSGEGQEGSNTNGESQNNEESGSEVEGSQESEG